jgi:leucyl aminopeptidase
MCSEVGMTCRVLDEDAMREEDMGLLLSVSQGSCQPAKFIVMEHKPQNAANVKSGPIVLIGKGVSFDTGGYSLKPQNGMVGMKGDMSGAAAVIGAMRAIGDLNLPLHVVGLVPSVENMISASAYKPNDVFIAKNGSSVEIINTDAEGRLVLADALCYADSLNPSAVIDVATLTGYKKMALGNRFNALFVNDDALNESLTKAGENVGEPLWRMPLDDTYDRQLKTKVADLKNDGGPAAGAVTAARFLAHFVGEWPWAHIDIAGSHLYSDGPEDTSRSYLTPGATSTPLRGLVEFLRSQCE